MTVDELNAILGVLIVIVQLGGKNEAYRLQGFTADI